MLQYSSTPILHYNGLNRSFLSEPIGQQIQMSLRTSTNGHLKLCIYEPETFGLSSKGGASNGLSSLTKGKPAST